MGIAALLLVVALRIPGAVYTIDASGTMSLPQAEHAAFAPARAFRYPGVASVLHPLVIWMRFPSPTHYPRYLVAADGVGYASLYFTPTGSGQDLESRTFGMRVPFANRTIPRAPPTLELSRARVGTPMYLRLSLDDESRVESIVELVNRTELRAQDATLQHLASIALLFMGIFVSLAAANIFVYFFVRERAYVIYTGMMLSNALFAATYMHASAWRWFWPHASVPDALAEMIAVVLEALFLLAFARSFLKTKTLIPRLDRVALWSCSALMALAVFSAIFFPSYHFTSSFTGRELFLVLVVVYAAIVFALAVAAMRAGSLDARFFVVSNGAVSATAAWVALSNVVQHSPSISGNFLALMTGQAVEGWLLFGALAFRLRNTMAAHINEQQQRLVAQAELLAQTQALLLTRQQASTDALTEIANRRVFDETLTREWARCARSGTAVCLMIVDVDHFKRFNDTYGHVAGDRCLQAIAKAIASCMRRPADICARYGGEEFGIILGDTDALGGCEIAEAVASAVRGLHIPHVASESGMVTVSIGVAAEIPQTDVQPETLIREADLALYSAKESGRNRVQCALLR